MEQSMSELNTVSSLETFQAFMAESGLDQSDIPNDQEALHYARLLVEQTERSARLAREALAWLTAHPGTLETTRKGMELMKIAQQIAQQAVTSSEAMEAGEAKAHGKDQNWSLELTKYVFDDNSVLAVQDARHFGFDADDAASIRAYEEWLGAADESEASEIARLLDALN